MLQHEIAEARQAAHKLNAAALISRLAPELVSEIMIQGLPPYLVEPKPRWTSTLSHLRTLGAISSGWRRLRDDTAVLWTFITYDPKRDDRIDLKSLELLKLFLKCSKESLFELVLDFPKDRNIRQRPEPYDLPFLRPHFLRCWSLSVTGPSYFKNIFPLPSNMPALRYLKFDGDRHVQTDLPFFESEPNSKLHSLSVWMFRGRIPKFSTIPSAFITTLDFTDHLLSPEVLSFATQCPLLESLAVGNLYDAFEGLYLRNDVFDIPVHVFPRLLSLQIEDQIPPLFPFAISTPQLRSLYINCTGLLIVTPTKPYSREPFKITHLETLVLGYLPRNNVNIDTFIFSFDHLRALEFREALDSYVVALMLLDHLAETELPTLEWIRIFDSKMPSNIEAIKSSLQVLIHRHPIFKAEIHLTGLDDHPGHEIAAGPLPLLITKCFNASGPCYKPISELLEARGAMLENERIE